jgi:hypothetical protein
MNDKLVGFLYGLLRDHIPVGVAEKLVLEHEQNKDGEVTYTNTYLRDYCISLVERLTKVEEVNSGNIIMEISNGTYERIIPTEVIVVKPMKGYLNREFINEGPH